MSPLPASGPAAVAARRRMLHVVCAVIAVACAAVGADPAGAHTRSVSYSRWDLDNGGARVELRVPLVELAPYPNDAVTPARLAAMVVLSADGDVCRADDPRRVEGGPSGWAVYRWTAHCARGGPRSLRSSITLGGGGHAHLARVASRGEVRERLLAGGDEWPLDAAEATAAAPSATSYVPLGVMHILSGVDHLVFLLALLLLADSLGELLRLVTSFTAAHTVTLALGALGVLRPDAAAVEALIGFSIVLVAVENVWLVGGRDRAVPGITVALLLAAAAIATTGALTLPPLAWLGLAVFAFCHFALVDDARGSPRVLVAFAFGLIHGFGFAGNLLELELPVSRLVPALLGFNGGVELGQLAVVALAWPLLRALARREPGGRGLVLAGSAPILAIGVFWLVTRSVR